MIAGCKCGDIVVIIVVVMLCDVVGCCVIMGRDMWDVVRRLG